MMFHTRFGLSYIGQTTLCHQHLAPVDIHFDYYVITITKISYANFSFSRAAQEWNSWNNDPTAFLVIDVLKNNAKIGIYSIYL